MLLTVVNSYKTPEKPYANGFVHRRVVSYLENGIDTKVFVLNIKQKKRNYVFDGVNVSVGHIDELVNLINEKAITAICVHFLNKSMIKVLKKIQKSIPIFIFVHGNEALHWYERVFPYSFSGVKTTNSFFKYMISNIINMRVIKSFLASTDKDITIITVSEWMKKLGMKNWKTNDIPWIVIPNIIDNKLFNYEEKDPNLRFKILLIRSFSSGKYANDIAIKVINGLRLIKEYDKIEIKVIGEGQLFNKIIKKIKDIEKVNVQKGFIQQDEIALLHKSFGIFLCPTRQDAQGVSMCEAMSSGLIPITSNNTAIPEFLPSDFGLACNNAEEMIEKIKQIISDETLFSRMSKEVSETMLDKCSYSSTTFREIELIKSTIDNQENRKVIRMD